MSNLKLNIALCFAVVILLAVGVLNLMLWDNAYNACLARGSSVIWCRITEEWQIARYLFGF